MEHILAYHKTIKKGIIGKVIEHFFLVGELVIYNNQRNVNTLLCKKGKFSPNWLGPYIITKVYGSGEYEIIDMNGVSFKEPINIMICVAIMCNCSFSI